MISQDKHQEECMKRHILVIKIEIQIRTGCKMSHINGIFITSHETHNWLDYFTQILYLLYIIHIFVPVNTRSVLLIYMWTGLCTHLCHTAAAVAGGGVALMKEEMRREKERVRGSLNRQCLQSRREEVDKETMVCKHRGPAGHSPAQRRHNH